MITRDVNQLFVVPAFVHEARFSGCGAGPLNYTCSTVGGIEAPGSTNLRATAPSISQASRSTDSGSGRPTGRSCSRPTPTGTR